MYGLFIAIGVFSAIIFSERIVKARGLNVEVFWQAVFWTFIAGVVGARLYHVIDFWEIYRQNLIFIPQVWYGGLGIFGALLLGLPVLIWFLKKSGEDVWAWLDVFALPIPFAQAVGRLGNYFNFELMPYAIYEAVANLFLFFVLYLLSKKSFRGGSIFVAYVAGYSLIRLALEPLRVGAWAIGGVNVAQAVSVVLLLVSAWIFMRRRKEGYEKGASE